MTEASKQRMEELIKNIQRYCCCPGPTCSGCDKMTKNLIEAGYQAGMQDPDANKKPYNVIYGDEENLYRLYVEMLEIADNRFKKIEELQEKYDQVMKDWSMDAIKKTEVIVKLEAENKKLRKIILEADKIMTRNSMFPLDVSTWRAHIKALSMGDK